MKPTAVVQPPQPVVAGTKASVTSKSTKTAVKTTVGADGAPVKKSAPRRGRKRGRCNLSYCVEEVCIHCTCDGSCGRGHAPKLCGNRRYEKRANCNQCKVAYYCTKRKNAELMENALPKPPPLMNAHNLPSAVPPANKLGRHKPLMEQDVLKKTLIKPAPAMKKIKRENLVPLLPPAPPMDAYTSFGTHVDEEAPFMQGPPETVVDWEDVWRASALSLGETIGNGSSSPMSSASSEADLMSLAPEYENGPCETKMYECSDLKDPDLCQPDDGLFNCLLDDMEVGNWGNFDVEDAKADFNTDKLFADVF